ncbi:MAG: hypothetical protein JNN32_10990 [Flavobacteriales bacterium]|nr:hypothetical protein [Flavobacteriales bacterium]
MSVNTFDTTGISATVVAICYDLLSRYPTASFGMLASRSFDVERETTEPRPTKRFQVWTGVIGRKFPDTAFAHYRFTEENGYLLINNCHSDAAAKVEEYREMFKGYGIVAGV